MTGEFSAQMASNAENVSIGWRHHEFAHNVCIYNWMTYLEYQTEALIWIIGIIFYCIPIEGIIKAPSIYGLTNYKGLFSGKVISGTYNTQELPCHWSPGPHMFKVYSW